MALLATMSSIYLRVIQGFAIALEDPTEIREIENFNLGWISSISVDEIVRLHDVPSIGAYPFRSMNIPLQSHDHGFPSTGIKVAVLDQGIRFNEAPFITPGMKCEKLGDEGCRVKEIYDFIIPKNESNHKLSKPGDASKYKRFAAVYGDHGTAIASLLGGSDPLAPGIAQQVDFHDYRVFDASAKSAMSESYLALDFALLDDVDTICMSFGDSASKYGGKLGPYTKRNSKDEIILTTSVGNDGDKGLLFQVTDMAETSSILAVGSFMNPYKVDYYLSLKFSGENGEMEEINNLKFKFLRNEGEFSTFLGASLPNAMVLTESRQVRFIGQNINAETKQKAILFVMCKDTNDCMKKLTFAYDGQIKPTAIIFFGVPEIDLPKLRSYQIPLGQGLNTVSEFQELALNIPLESFSIHEYYTFVDEMKVSPDPTSTWGPNGHLDMKPDVSAIGGNVLGFVGGRVGRRIFIGTSFGNANANGLAALFLFQYKARNKTITFKDFHMRVQNAAIPHIFRSERARMEGFQGLAYSAYKQGAGLIRLHELMHSKVVVNPSKINLRSILPNTDKKHRTVTYTINIFNDGEKETIYSIQHIPAISVAPLHATLRASVHHTQARVEFLTVDEEQVDPRSPKFIVSPKETKSLTMSFTIDVIPPVRHLFVSGYIQFTPMAKHPKGELVPRPNVEDGYGGIHVPYSFLYGDTAKYPAIIMEGPRSPFLTNTMVAQNTPNFLKISGAFPRYTKENPSTQPFTLNGTSKPVIALCLTVPLQIFTLDLFDVNSGARLGQIVGFKNLPSLCYLFLLTHYPHPLRAKLEGDALMPEKLGWDGYYSPREGPTTRKRVENGNYFICAYVKRQMESDAPTRVQAEFCTSSFSIEVENVDGSN